MNARVADWWREGHRIVPGRWTRTTDYDLNRLGHALNAYYRCTRWVRPWFWLYIWRAPERYHCRGPATREWHDLDRWAVRWCRLRGHPGIIYYNPGGFEPDTRCRRCLENIG